MIRVSLSTTVAVCGLSLAVALPSYASSVEDPLSRPSDTVDATRDLRSSASASILGCAPSRSDQSSATRLALEEARSADTRFEYSGVELTTVDVNEQSGEIRNGSKLDPNGEFEFVYSALKKYEGKGGQSVYADLNSVRAVALEAQCLLRSGGYSLSSVKVLPQEVTPGEKVKLAVVRGRVSSLSVSINNETFTYGGGSTYGGFDFIDSIPDGVSRSEAKAIRNVMRNFEPLLGLGAATDDDFERAVLLARRTPGVSLTPNLSASSDRIAENLNLTINIVDVDRVQGDIVVMNYSPETLNRWGALGRLSVNNTIVPGDQVSLSGYASEDFKSQLVARAEYSAPLFNSDMRWKGYFSYADSEPGQTLSSIDLTTNAVIAGGEIQRPILVRQVRSLDAAIGFEHVTQDLQVFGNRLTNDQLSIAYAKVSGGFVWPRFASTSFEASIRQGLDTFGASKEGDLDVSRIGANPQATVLKFKTNSVFDIHSSARLKFRMEGQTTNDPLLAYEEHVVGNFTIGRGYEPGELTGDRGIGGALDLEVGPIDPTRGAFPIKLNPFVFFDANAVWNEDVFAEDHRYVTSKGFGVRSELPYDLYLDLTYANATQKAQSFSSGPPGSLLLVQLRKQF